MPRLNGTAKWLIPVIISACLAAFIVADRLGSPTATKVAACEATDADHEIRLRAVEEDTTCLKARFDGFEKTLLEIKDDVKELRRHR